MRFFSEIPAEGVSDFLLIYISIYERNETMIKINGNEVDAAGMTLAEYLKTTEYNPARIAVERNGDIVPKARYEETVLCDGDAIEIVSFVGGG